VDLAGYLFLTEHPEDALHNCWLHNDSGIAYRHRFEMDLSGCFCCEHLPDDLVFSLPRAATFLSRLRDAIDADDISFIWLSVLGHPVNKNDPPAKQDLDLQERERRRLDMVAALSAHGYAGICTSRLRANKHRGRVAMSFAASTLRRTGDEVLTSRVCAS